MSSAPLSRSSPIPQTQTQVASPSLPPLPPDSVYTSCYCEENIYMLAQAFAQLSESNATDRHGLWPWQIFVVFISNGGKTVALWNQKAARDTSGVVVWDYHVVLVLRLLPVQLPRHRAPHAGAPHAYDVRPHDRSGPGTHPCDTVTERRSDRPGIPPGDATAAAAFPPAPSHAPAPVPVLPAPAGASADSWPLPELGGGEGGGGGADAGEAWVYDFDTSLVPVPCPWRDYIAGTFPYAFDRRLADQIDERFHSLFRVIPADVYLDHFASDRSHMLVHPPAPRQDELAHAVEHHPSTAESDTHPAALGDGRSGGSGTAGSRRIDAAGEADLKPLEVEGPRYSMPPPPYPPLCGTKARALGITNNLMESFVSMSTPMSGAHLQAPATTSTAAVSQHEGGPDSKQVQPGATIDSGSVHSAGWQLPSASRSELAVGYGQVMDMDSFVAWLAGSTGSEKAM